MESITEEALTALDTRKGRGKLPKWAVFLYEESGLGLPSFNDAKQSAI